MKLGNLALVTALGCVFWQGSVLDLMAKEYSLGVRQEAKVIPAEPIHQPLPTIPHHLQEECLNACCEARFNIEASGKFKVHICQSSGHEELDEIALDTLEKWKFKPATLEGKAVASKKRVKIEFVID